ncbi:formin-like protein 5 [Nomascus leucogenys]|uniref:formin-like protein 5 n=1 Tax=Nomascus leucogenys TaxID=61853 RepID=UPI00122D7F32|nr:formin-like protein 5 [Nomascus leucogenys]
MPVSRTLILPPRKAPPPGRHEPGRFQGPASRIALSWPRPRTRQPGLSPAPALTALILALPQASPSCRSSWPHPRPRPHNAHPGLALGSAPTKLLLTLSAGPAPCLPPRTALGPPPLQSRPGFRPVSRQRCGPDHVMAPEENAGSELLLQSFERRFLAARALPSFPWQVGGGAERPAGLSGVQGQTGWVSVVKPPAFLPRECLGSRRSGPRHPVPVPGAWPESLAPLLPRGLAAEAGCVSTVLGGRRALGVGYSSR